MEFLQGIAKAGQMDFLRSALVGLILTMKGKGPKIAQLISEDYRFLVCHINATDEASHIGDTELKIKCLEMIDQLIIRPVVEYFQRNMEELGGVMIVPAHYSNSGGYGSSFVASRSLSRYGTGRPRMQFVATAKTILLMESTEKNLLITWTCYGFLVCKSTVKQEKKEASSDSNKRDCIN